MKIKNHFTTENLLFASLLVLLIAQLFLDMNCFIFFCCVSICVALNVLRKKHRIISIVSVLIVYSFVLCKIMSFKIEKKNEIQQEEEVSFDVEIQDTEEATNKINNESKNKNDARKSPESNPTHNDSKDKKDFDGVFTTEAPKMKPKPTKVNGVYETTVIEFVVRTKGDQEGTIMLDNKVVGTFEKTNIPIVM